MKKDYGSDKMSALNAKFEAQKIAFGPIMFQAARLLRELGILDALRTRNDNGHSPEDISQKTNVSLYGVKVLLDAGLSMGVVRMVNEKYILTKTGFFILSDTLTKTNFDFVQDVCYKAFYHLEESVRTGKPAGLKELGDWETIYPALTLLPGKAKESWFNFDHYYSDEVFPYVLPVIFNEDVKHLLDIGGNTGKFAIHCANHSENVEVTILDLELQLRKAKDNIKQNGFEDRIHTFLYNLLDESQPFPTGFDAIWMSQLLDCFSEEQILSILKRAHKALDDDGYLYILELFWDRQEYEASTYCLNATSLYFTCIANGNSRMYHSDDFVKLSKKAGLEIVEEYDNLGISHTLLKCRKI